MIIEKVVQKVITNPESLFDLSKNFLADVFQDEYQKEINASIIRPFRLIISGPSASGLWMYVNKDISPVVIDEKFDWNLKDFGNFNHIYFIDPNKGFDNSNFLLVITMFYYDDELNSLNLIQS